MAEDNVRGYTLRDYQGRIVYVGTTNNMRARRAEHKLDGKKFKTLKVETGPMSREKAEAWESRRIKSYRDHTGKNPRYNKADDGKPNPKPNKRHGARISSLAGKDTILIQQTVRDNVKGGNNRYILDHSESDRKIIERHVKIDDDAAIAKAVRKALTGDL